MIWDTSIWRLGCSNHSKIRSAQKCYPCLRYVVSPMSPGRTFCQVGGADGIRTHDLLDAIEARSQLRHGPTGRTAVLRFYSTFPVSSSRIGVACDALATKLPA